MLYNDPLSMLSSNIQMSDKTQAVTLPICTFGKYVYGMHSDLYTALLDPTIDKVVFSALEYSVVI